MTQRVSIESTVILENLDVDTLRAFTKFASSQEFDLFAIFCQKYAKTKISEVLYLPTENERKLANELSQRKGAIGVLGVLVDVIRGAQKEISKRKKD